jgi:hypothetical protein
MPARRKRGAAARAAWLASAFAALVLAWPAGRGIGAQQPTAGLPDRFPDEQFWAMSTSFSEPDGEFSSDTLVSNERAFQHVLPVLERFAPADAYLGVAPDQNFAYILGLRPRIAFVIDVRRGNLLEHLMFKALIEMSSDRADFLSRLFSRPRPPGLDASATAAGLFGAFAGVAPREPLRDARFAEVATHLTARHGFPLADADLDGIRAILAAFARFGPDITYASNAGRGGRDMPSYADLQQMTDLEGRNRGYLATEAAFADLREFQRRNLLIPVIGDFAGTRTIAEIGRFLRRHGAVVSAFYTSNVEQYLFRDGRWRAFYANVERLPLARGSAFIRATPGSSRVDPIHPFLADLNDGRIRTYADITSRGGIR